VLLRSLTAAVLGVIAVQAVHARVQEPAGDIVGRVSLRQLPVLRVVGRYAGAGNMPHDVESVPGVVYIEGIVPGHAPKTFAERPRMSQRDTTFHPEMLIVPVGATVEFPNQDGFFHNVFSYSRAKRFDLGRFPRGESKSVRFDNPGVVNVYCEIHKWMRGVVVVVENPFHSMIADDGTFRITGVPPGTYKLVIWQVDHGRKELSVTVTDAVDAHVNAAL
jgi:plastocyanin